MEIVKEKDGFEVVRFDKDDYMQNFERINSDMSLVLSSYEYTDYDYEEAKQDLSDKNTDFFLNPVLDAKVYLLKNKFDNMPVGFALFSHDEERDDWHLEFISTHFDYSGIGLGETLMKICAKDLAKTEFRFMSSVVNKSNAASLAMHNHFANSIGLKTARQPIEGGRIVYQFDLKTLDTEKVANDIDEIIY